jgi:hypothetical protein
MVIVVGVSGHCKGWMDRGNRSARWGLTDNGIVDNTTPGGEASNDALGAHPVSAIVLTTFNPLQKEETR